MATSTVDLSAGLTPKASDIDLSAGLVPVTAAPPQQPGFFENLGHAFGIGTQEAETRRQNLEQHPIRTIIQDQPAVQAIQGAYQGGKRILGELGQAGSAVIHGNLPDAAVHAITAIPLVGPAINKMADQAPPTVPGQSYGSRVMAAATPGNVGTALGTAAQIAPLALGAADAAAPGRATIPTPGATAIREAALGDPNAAAMRGLHVSPQSPKAVATLNAVQGARPFLEGVQGLKDLQDRVPVAKQEIWAPYEDAIDKIGDNKVKGPDGTMTTVRDLEARRLELSAQLRTLKRGGPEAMALAQQKGLTQANLMREESMVKAALDPQLRQFGIDPVGIRKAFGQVSQVGSRVAGKTTTGEADQPSGFGRMTNLQLDTPRTWIGEPLQGLRDLAAGRPAWAANPTDMNIREAFRMGGPRPDFTTPVQPSPQIAGLLPSQAGGPHVLEYYPEMSADEKIAALMHYLRQYQQRALPASAQPIRLPPPND